MVNERCCYCDAEYPIDQMEPESGDMWVCWDCWDRMAESDHTPLAQRMGDA
jgi:hypothetical protein